MLTDNKRLHQPTDTNSNPTHDGYRHIPGPEPFPTGSPEARRLTELVDEQTPWSRHHSPNSQNREPPKREPRKGLPTDYRGISERREHCRSPKGLKLEETGGARSEYLIAGCQLCEACKGWARELDNVRISEALGSLVWFTIPDDRWETVRQKLRGENLPYFTAPLANEQRAVITGANYPGPANPVEDLPALLAKLDHQRDRTEGRSGRRVSTGSMESRKALERKVYATDQPVEKGPEADRRVVGMFTPTAFMRTGRPLHKAADWLLALCDSLGVEAEKSDLGVLVTETAELDKALGVKAGRDRWKESEPPPDWYDQRSLWTELPEEWHNSSEPLEWFPTEYEAWRESVQSHSLERIA